ncbi:hypothetical protein [Polaromonas sp. P5_D5]|jgi:hypothetical protein
MDSENVNRNRRNNLLIIIREFSEKELAAGESPVGMLGRIARQLGLSAGGLSQFKGDAKGTARNIGDAAAAQIESKSGKPKGWMDTDHGGDAINPAENAFIELARIAWRTTDAKGRRLLMQLAKRGFGGQTGDDLSHMAKPGDK